MATAEPTIAALIVIDMQEDFCSPHGSLAIDEARGLAPVINSLLESPSFALKIATQDFHPPDHVSFASQHVRAASGLSSFTMANPENPAEEHSISLWPDHCVQGTFGAHIIPEIDQTKFSKIVQKGWDSRLESFSGFGPPFRHPAVFMTDLHATLKNASITDVFIVGVGFDGCVKSTAVDAAELGYKTYIIKEGTNACTRSKERRTKTLKDLDEARVSIVDVKSSVKATLLFRA